MTKVSFDELKRFLRGCVDLGDFERNLPQLKKLYGDRLDEVQGLPEDVVKLALSNDCAISCYTDFHTEDKLERCRERYGIMAGRLEKRRK